LKFALAIGHLIESVASLIIILLIANNIIKEISLFYCSASLLQYRINPAASLAIHIRPILLKIIIF